MKMIELEPVHANTQDERVCNYIERTVLWVLITATVIVTLCLLWETRESMHLRNNALSDDLTMQKAYQHNNVRYFMP